MKLGLGTAQLGLDYGISNRDGRTSRDEARAILERAASAGVRLLDTAPAYGEAESVLGELVGEHGAFDVVTKTPHGLSSAAPGAAQAALLGSLERLRRPRVAGLLVHDHKDLLGPRGALVFDELAALREEGLVQRIGASLYHPEEADELLERFPLELVQLPVSVLDQRALTSGLLDRCKQRGVQVHARSVFLQGLLLMPPSDLPPALRAARPILQAFRDRAQSLGLSPLEAALGFVVDLPQVDVVICGLNRRAHLEELLAGLRSRVPPGAFGDLALDDRAILDPSGWPAFR